MTIRGRYSPVGVKIQKGTAQGQILFWDATAGEWTKAEVTEMMWDDTAKSFFASTITDGTASLTGGSLTSVKLGTLTSNGFVKTSGGDGTLSVDTSSYSTTAHRHDGHTLEHDGVNSNGGAFSFTTSGLVTFNQSIASPTIELGHATDTTLARVSAGVVSIEGVNIAMAGGAFHDGFSDFVANEHINHTSVTLTAGTGLTGGGDISANRTFAVDGLLEDLDTLGANSADGEFVVGTGAGVLAWESGATARTSIGVGTGDSPTFAGLLLTSVVNASADTDKFLVLDGSNDIDFRTGTEVLSDIGGAASGHLHDGDTLQHDGVNSNGGAFAFTTSGAVTFSQDVILNGTENVGLDLSGGTWANANINLATNPIIQHNGTKLFKANDTTYNLLIGSDAFNGLPGGITLAQNEGTYNVALGYQAGYNNDSSAGGNDGSQNVYIGYYAGRGGVAGAIGAVNVGIGVNALTAITEGDNNVAVGGASLMANTTGGANVALGSFALNANIGGSNNMAIGGSALRYNTGSNSNVAIGASALYWTTSPQNVAIGQNALAQATGGAGQNVGIGFNCGGGTAAQGNRQQNVWIGSYCGSSSTGNNNTCIGYSSANALTSGTDNVFLGRRSGIRQTTLSNLLIIDNQDRSSAANEITTSLIYGVFAATAAAQTLRINAGTTISENLTVDGNIYSELGVRTVTVEHGAGMAILNYGDTTPVAIGMTGWYDHTGGSSENLFIRKTGTAFDQENEDDGDWIIFTAGDLPYAMCEIKQFIDGDNVIVSGLDWDGDIDSDGTPGTYMIIKHPTFVSGQGGNHEFSVGSGGEFEVHSYGFTGGTMAHFKNKVSVDDSTAVEIEVVGNGYQDLDALHIDYQTGALQPGDSSDVIHVIIDEGGAVAGDSTTSINSITLEKSNVNSDIETDGIHVGPGHTNAMHVVGTAADDPAFGYEVSGGGVTETDRVNGGAGDGNAFLEAGNNLQIFDADNDYILIGSAAAFEIIEVVLATGGSKDSELEFYWPDGAGSYTQFYPSDSTSGFQHSGSITFSASVLVTAGWVADDQSMDGTAITNGFYIAIKRTKNGVYTYPTEDYFKTYANQTGGMRIRGDGVVKLPYLSAAPANLENGLVWTEADGLHMYVGGGEVTVP